MKKILLSVAVASVMLAPLSVGAQVQINPPSAFSSLTSRDELIVRIRQLQVLVTQLQQLLSQIQRSSLKITTSMEPDTQIETPGEEQVETPAIDEPEQDVPPATPGNGVINTQTPPAHA